MTEEALTEARNLITEATVGLGRSIMIARRASGGLTVPGEGGWVDGSGVFRTNAVDTPYRLRGSSPRAGWDATMDIGGWLRGLGLGQYEAMFRESEIDADVLPELTESDLTQLGVPLGHRKRLLKAIAALGVAEKAPATASTPPPKQPFRSVANAASSP